MKASELYKRLDQDFGIDQLKDDWSFMRFSDMITAGFRERYMGLVLDNTKEVKKVYTATMPDLDVLDRLIQLNEKDVMLFSHHAMGYDPNIQGMPFYDIPEEYLLKLRERRISFYVLHLPLDKNGEYSTAVSLARALDLQVSGEFCEYEGVKAGVICQTSFQTAGELAEHVRKVVGHEVRLMAHGDGAIRDGRVAIAAGGGSVGFVAGEIAGLGINTYITGCTREVPEVEFIADFHKIVKSEKINVIGATHYSTEKYACMAMTGYFENLGVPAEFIEGNYFLEDL